MGWIEAHYSDVMPWLLEPESPSVRYWTLTLLLNRSPDHAEVQEARQQIMQYGPAAEILTHYAGNGQWEGERSYYTYKYTSTHWQLVLLAELAADGTNEFITAACQRMVEDVARESRPVVWPCFHGNLVGYLHAFGHTKDERVRTFEKELARSMVQGKCECDINGDLPCAWGTARALWGFSHIPPTARAPHVKKAIDYGIRFLGRHELCKGDYPSSGARHRLWDRLNFPLFYQADVLFILRTLAALNRLGDKPVFGRAVEWLEDRCRNDGRWNCSSPYRRQTWTPLENHGRPSKWATLQALYVIKTASS